MLRWFRTCPWLPYFRAFGAALAATRRITHRDARVHIQFEFAQPTICSAIWKDKLRLFGYDLPLSELKDELL